MNCYYCTKEDKATWTQGDIQGYVSTGQLHHAVVLPKDQTKLVTVEFANLEVGSEHPAERLKKAEAVRLKAQQDAEAKQAAIDAKAAAKARIKAEALAKAEADADAKAEAEAHAEVSKTRPVDVPPHFVPPSQPFIQQQFPAQPPLFGGL